MSYAAWGGALLPCVPGPRLLGQAEVGIFILCAPPPRSRHLAQPLPLIRANPGGSHAANHLLGPAPQPSEPHESSSAPQTQPQGAESEPTSPCWEQKAMLGAGELSSRALWRRQARGSSLQGAGERKRCRQAGLGCKRRVGFPTSASTEVSSIVSARNRQPWGSRAASCSGAARKRIQLRPPAARTPPAARSPGEPAGPKDTASLLCDPTASGLGHRAAFPRADSPSPRQMLCQPGWPQRLAVAKKRLGLSHRGGEDGTGSTPSSPCC